MTNQPSPVEEQEKLLEEALNVVKVQVREIVVKTIGKPDPPTGCYILDLIVIIIFSLSILGSTKHQSIIIKSPQKKCVLVIKTCFTLIYMNYLLRRLKHN